MLRPISRVLKKGAVAVGVTLLFPVRFPWLVVRYLHATTLEEIAIDLAVILHRTVTGIRRGAIYLFRYLFNPWELYQVFSVGDVFSMSRGVGPIPARYAKSLQFIILQITDHAYYVCAKGYEQSEDLRFWLPKRGLQGVMQHVGVTEQKKRAKKRISA